ncbi:MAG: hypothetical protein QM760_15780 [Nibricoccus sp.]
MAGNDVATGTLFDIDAARVAVVLNGSSGRLMVLDGDGLGGGGWKLMAPPIALSASNVASNWQRLVVRLNYTAKTYDLYLDGQMIAADIKFRLNNAAYVSWFSIKGHTGASAALDDLYVGVSNPLFADVNNNGIADTWETAMGLSLQDDNRSQDIDGDGLIGVIEYQNQSHPRDYYNGSVPVITSLVAGNGQPEAQGRVSVKVTRSSDGAILINAPVTLEVTTGAAKITASPGGLLGNSIVIRTDASGIGTGYVRFTTQSSDTLIATAQSGAQSASLSIALTPPASMPLKELLAKLSQAAPGAPITLENDFPSQEPSACTCDLQYGTLLIAAAAKAREEGNAGRVIDLIAAAKTKLAHAHAGALSPVQKSQYYFLSGIIAEKYEGRLNDARDNYQGAVSFDASNKRASEAYLRVQKVLSNN